MALEQVWISCKQDKLTLTCKNIYIYLPHEGYAVPVVWLSVCDKQLQKAKHRLYWNFQEMSALREGR